MSNAFNGCSNLQISATDVPNLSSVSSMDFMFRDCIVLNSPANIGTWNVSNVTNMYSMFYSAPAFNQPLGAWNTSAVTDMSLMFSGASSFNQPIGGWNTGNVTNMQNMFQSASAFNQSIGGWNTGNVTNMSNLFNYANAFDQNVTSWNISKVTNMNSMFSNAQSFNQNLGPWGTKFNANVNLNYFINWCASMSSANYDATLQGWSLTTVTGRTVRALTVFYCTGLPFRNILTSSTGVGGKGWTIDDSGLLGSPLVNVHPQPSTGSIGVPVTFSVNALGNKLTYLWSNGATGNSMNTSIAGSYNVTVSSGCGTPAVSLSATLTTIPSTSLVQQPSSIAVSCLGANFTFAVSATGASLTYLWNTGAVTRNVSTNMAGNYLATVSGTCGSIVSNIATLSGANPTIIVAQPISVSTCLGSTVPFSVSATGTNLSYLWNTLETTPNISTNVGGSYRVTVSGTCGIIPSNIGNYNVVSAPAIVTHPVSVNTCVGSNAIFSVSASGGNLTYLWNNNATTRTVSSNVIGSYQVTVSGSCGAPVVSNTAELNSLLGTSIVSHPMNVFSCSGSTVTFGVSALGSNLSYLWSNGATTPTMNTSIAGNYRVTVTGACGDVISNTAIYSLIPNTAITQNPISGAFCEGNSGLVNVSANGANLSFLWNNGSTLQSFNTTLTDSYRVTVSGTCGSAVSASAYINQTTKTKIITQPASFAIFPNQPSATFRVDAVASNIDFKWSNGQSGSNEITVSTLGNYIVTVSGICGIEVSKIASLTNASSADVFITKWNLSLPGSNPNVITFGAQTTGRVDYIWETVTNTGVVMGVGTFSGSIINISGIPANSTIRLSILGANFNSFYSSPSFTPKRLVDVIQWGSTEWTSLQSAFNFCENLNITATDLPNLNLVESMSNMFGNCINLNGPSNIGQWNTSKVKNMSQMFSNCPIFNQSLENWNVSNVTNMSSMFASALIFNQPLDNWDVSKVTNIVGMFTAAKAFNQPIGNWNTSNVTHMNYMFYLAEAFNQSIGNWNISNVVNLDNMFYNAKAFNQPIGNWNTSNVVFMGNMFPFADAFDQPLNNWNVSNVTNMEFMFYGTKAFNQPLSSWNISSVQNMSAMFTSSKKFDQNPGAWGTKFHPNVDLNSFISYSNMSIQSYEATLEGFSSTTVTGRTLGVDLLKYCNSSYRDILTSTSVGGKNWTINNDIKNGNIPTSIILQPLSILTCSGESATFEISASGENLNYLWSNGETSQSFSTNIPGSFTVTVVGNCGNKISNTVTLNTINGPNILVQPITQSSCTGDNLSLSVSALGTNLTYLWEDGNTTSTIFPTISGIYSVTVSGSCGLPVVSNSAIIDLKPNTSIITQPISQTSCPGVSVDFTVSAVGTNISYLWNNGGNTSTISTNQARNYLVTVSGSCGAPIISNVVTLSTLIGTSIVINLTDIYSYFMLRIVCLCG